MRAAVGIGIFCCAVLALAGCAAPPPVRYERCLEIHELAGDVDFVSDGYKMLVPARSRGRFGCGLAVAKFVAGDQAGVVNPVRLTPAEEARWTAAVAGITELRDLQFIPATAATSEEAPIEALCVAADVLRAGLLLVYAPNRYGPNSAQVVGVLYDVAGCRPLASLHASASFLSAEGAEVAPDDTPGDQRGTDGYYQASRAFEQHLRECLLELIRSDLSAPTTQPHGWDTPREDRWWLPGGRGGGG